MFHLHHFSASLHRANSFLASQLEEIKPEEYFNEQVRIERWTMSEHVRPSSVKPKDSRSSVSSQELTEECDHDRNYIEKFVREELSPSPCLLPLPPQIIESHDSEIWMSSGNKEDSESSVSDSSTLTLATKKKAPKTWEFVDGLLRENLRSDKDSENSVSSKQYKEEINSTRQEEFENKNWTNGDNMEDLLRKKQLLPPPPLLTPYTSSAWLAPPESHTNTVLTQGGVQEHMFRLPPPTFTHRAPLHAHPPVIRAPPGVTVNTNTPFSLGAQHDHMFRPPPPTFTHHAPPSPLVLPDLQQMIIRPPALPAGGADSQKLNLHSLSGCYLPENVLLQPAGVLNGEILYKAIQTPLNVNVSKRVRDKQDVGRPYVKKPPNAFILFLKEIRPKVVSELNISRSAMVNRFVGEMWNCLPVEVKAKYFEKARLEQKLHQQQHPGWSASDNYGKKRKGVKNKTSESSSSSSTAYTPRPVPFLHLIPDSASESAQHHRGPKAETD
ncbi:lymphoid enhancer-binding factor 1-like [Xiphophorus couchianus]|uniref:lymphoid enhancer-binding factor 1-like n=1 Tax=Xiphophorus couchianus TaxID=32473 RepID=UPI001016FBA6|nr:lymphoid enhancer-binding factor 1-like [Xiphophorus couchianus]